MSKNQARVEEGCAHMRTVNKAVSWHDFPRNFTLDQAGMKSIYDWDMGDKPAKFQLGLDPEGHHIEG